MENDLRRWIELCESRMMVKEDESYWTPEKVSYWTSYAQNHIFKTPQEAHDWMFRALERGDKAGYGTVNGPEVNRTIADQTPTFRWKTEEQRPWGLPNSGYRIGARPKLSRARVDKIGSPEPEGSAPNVDWSGQDLQDSVSRVTKESILKDYVRAADHDKVTVYTAYVPNGNVPSAQLAEENPEDEDDGGNYDWSEMRRNATFPPLKLQVDRRGKVTILDGNHRTQFWREVGFDCFPAWVIDYRPIKRSK